MNQNKVAKQHKMKCKLGTFHIINLNDWVVTEDRAMNESILPKVNTKAKWFSKYYKRRVVALVAWALPYTHLSNISFPNKLETVSLKHIDSFQEQLFKETLLRIESKLIFRIQDDLPKVIDGRHQNFVAEMSFIQFQLFANHLRFHCIGDYKTEGDYVKDHGEIAQFLIHSIEFKSTNGKTIPPLASTSWCIPKWMDKSTGECKRGFVTQVRFLYSEYTGLLRVDMIYFTQRYLDQSKTWVFC